MPSPESQTHNNNEQDTPMTGLTNQSTTTARPPFSLLTALCAHADILFYLTTQHVPPATLLILYTLSAPFHYLVNSNYTSYMLSSARRWCPLGRPTADSTQPTTPGRYSDQDITTLLPFHNFLHLCIPDPTRRTTTITDTPGPTLRHATSGLLLQQAQQHLPRTTQIRHVPSFRYLSFLVHRHATVHSIQHSLKHLHGHPTPLPLPSTLLKLSYTLDLPTTALRAALFRNTNYWTDADIRLLLLFCVKLDMVFSDPVDGGSEDGRGRKLLLAQRSLDVAERFVGGKGGGVLELMRAWIRVGYVPREEHRGFSIMGVPPEEVGCLGREGWGKGRARLARPDELALVEAKARGGLGVRDGFLGMLVGGYVDLSALPGFPRGGVDGWDGGNRA